MTSNEFHLIAGMISNRVGVTCVAGGYLWQADIKNNVIYYPHKRYYSEADLGLLIHESAHLRFTTKWDEQDFEEACKVEGGEPKNGKQVFALMNALEDIRIEKQICDVYPGAEYYLNEMRESMWNNGYYYREDKRLWAMYGVYMDWEATHPDWAEESLFLRGLENNQKIRTAIDNTIDAVHKVPNIKTTDDLIDLMGKEILEHYLPLCDDAPPKSEMDEVMKKLLEFLKKMVKMKLGGKKQGVQKRKQAVKTEEDEEDAELQSGKKGGKLDFTMKRGRNMNEETLRKAVRDNFASARKAISIIKDLETKRYEGNYQSGKLQNRKLWKIRAGNYRIFTKQVADSKDDKDMVFALLVDESGSMGGTKIYQATIAAGLIGEALSRAGKRFAIYGFHDDVRVHKKFDQPFQIPDMLEIGKELGGTRDGEAVSKVAADLNRQPEKKKIMMVICDGESGSNGEYQLGSVVQKASKTIDVYGIGVQTNSVIRHYKNAIVINKPEDIGRELLKILKKNVGKRVR